MRDFDYRRMETLVIQGWIALSQNKPAVLEAIFEIDNEKAEYNAALALCRYQTIAEPVASKGKDQKGSRETGNSPAPYPMDDDNVATKAASVDPQSTVSKTDHAASTKTFDVILNFTGMELLEKLNALQTVHNSLCGLDNQQNELQGQIAAANQVMIQKSNLRETPTNLTQSMTLEKFSQSPATPTKVSGSFFARCSRNDLPRSSSGNSNIGSPVTSSDRKK